MNSALALSTSLPCAGYAAGNECHMPANLEYYDYECFEQLKEDVANFLPLAANIEVFGCEVDLIRPDTRQPLRDPIRETLRKHNRFQVVVKPCLEVGHNIWHFQNDNRPGYPKAVRVPVNDMGEVPDRAFYSAPVLRHVEVAQGLTKIGVAAWQSCHQLQIVKLPPSVVCLKDGAFQGCYALFKSPPQGVCNLVGELSLNAVRQAW